MYEILMVIYLVVAIALIAFILIQQGKGGGMGSAFGGSGASGTVFGAGGSGTFLTKTTTILAIVFFGVALSLGNLTSDKSSMVEENTLFPGDDTEQAAETSTSEIPTDTTELPTDTTELPNETTESDLPEATESDLPEDAVSEVTEDVPNTDGSN
ncbi:MAG: preprotein translocase subunit SecG [Enterobacterales bacterium]|jgi:preprotein translocase subunit SecG